MCLIAYNRGNGSRIPEKYIDAAYENNSDGFGIMWAADNVVHVIRGLYSLDDIKYMIDEMNDQPFVIHFRYRTRGKINENNCHPHRVLSSKNDGQDLWMMHNGTFLNLKADEEESDSVKFAKQLRSALRVFGSDVLYDSNNLSKMAARVGTMNKLVFLRGDGKLAIVNKNAGFQEDGIWYSNTYSLKSGYRTDKYAKEIVKLRELSQGHLRNDPLNEDISSKLLIPRNQKKNKKGKKKNKIVVPDSLPLIPVKVATEKISNRNRSIVRFVEKKLENHDVSGVGMSIDDLDGNINFH